MALANKFSLQNSLLYVRHDSYMYMFRHNIMYMQETKKFTSTLGIDPSLSFKCFKIATWLLLLVCKTSNFPIGKLVISYTNISKLMYKLCTFITTLSQITGSLAKCHGNLAIT